MKLPPPPVAVPRRPGGVAAAEMRSLWTSLPVPAAPLPLLSRGEVPVTESGAAGVPAVDAKDFILGRGGIGGIGVFLAVVEPVPPVEARWRR